MTSDDALTRQDMMRKRGRNEKIKPAKCDSDARALLRLLWLF